MHRGSWHNQQPPLGKSVYASSPATVRRITRTPSYDNINDEHGINEMVPEDKRLLVSLLSKHAGRRLKFISTFPSMAEIFIDGQAVCAELISFDRIANKFMIRQSDGTVNTIDFGQLTSVFDDGTLLRSFHEDCSREERRRYEEPLEDLYYYLVGRGRSMPLPKKQIASLGLSSDGEAIVRKVLKGGANMARLVDSNSVVNELGPFAEIILSDDAKAGGRFKRFSSVHVATTGDGSVLMVDGGWLAVDRSARFTTEARKFTTRNGVVATAADRRILRKLECFAMGELFEQERNEQEQDEQEPQDEKVALDVQEVLKDLQLDESPSGAQLALIRLGFWSSGEDIQERFKASFQPWKPDILRAADAYASFLENTASSPAETSSRTILPRLPCILIDDAKTSFRDDGIGLRPREITGRRIINGMKWEILVHITDMSDIYCPHPDIDLTQKDARNQLLPKALATLQDAARTRGYSRYDLPFGPLHLLPPVVLEELSLERSRRAVTLWVYIDEKSGDVLDSGVERTMIPAVQTMTYAEATDVMKGKKDDQALTTMAGILEAWDLQHSRNKRQTSRQGQPVYMEYKLNTPGHKLVDRALDLYSSEVYRLLGRRCPIPWTPGAEVWRGGRFATGVLRRYVDGQAQRQLLAVLCRYGGQPLGRDECKDIAMTANDARNSISNLTSYRPNNTKR